MRRWQRPGLAGDHEAVLNLTLTKREFTSISELKIGSSLEYQHSRALHFESCLDSNTWLVVDKLEKPPADFMPWHSWISSLQLRQPKAFVSISERCVDSSMDPKKDWHFTLTYNKEASYPGITYPERLEAGLIVEPGMFNELLHADLSQFTLTVSLWLSDQFESFLEWDEVAGTVIGWDVSKGQTIRLDKYNASIKTKPADAEPA